MCTLVEIEHAVEALPAAEQEALFRFLAARLEGKPPSVAPYRTRTPPGAVRPGINPDKLGHLPDES